MEIPSSDIVGINKTTLSQVKSLLLMTFTIFSLLCIKHDTAKNNVNIHLVKKYCFTVYNKYIYLNLRKFNCTPDIDNIEGSLCSNASEKYDERILGGYILSRWTFCGASSKVKRLFGSLAIWLY